MFDSAAQMRPANQDEITNRKKALRDAVFLITGMRFVSIICYVALYFLIEIYSESTTMSSILQVMTLVIIPLQVVHVYFLLSGAFKQNKGDIENALWFCIILAAYNTVLGILGLVYFIRTGYYARHLFMIIIFACLALSIITVFFYDVMIIYAYKKALENRASRQPEAFENSNVNHDSDENHPQ